MPVKSIKGQRFHEDDSYVLLWTKGPFGLSLPIFTSFYVYIKDRDLLVKASHDEKIFLLLCIKEWRDLGKEPKALRDTDLFSEYCSAVTTRGGARWTVFFKYESPREKMLQLAACT